MLLYRLHHNNLILGPNKQVYTKCLLHASADYMQQPSLPLNSIYQLQNRIDFLACNNNSRMPVLQMVDYSVELDYFLFHLILFFFNSAKIDLSTWNIAQIWQNLININETPHEPHQIANSIVENIKRNASVHAKLHFHTTSRFSHAEKNTSISDRYYSKPPSLFLPNQLFSSTFELVSLIFFFEICLSYFS